MQKCSTENLATFPVFLLFCTSGIGYQFLG
jgi:hypothetical protein